MKTFNAQNFSTLGLEEMFNVRGGDGETTNNNTTAETGSKDIIL